MEKWNSQLEHGQPIEPTSRLFFMQLKCGSLSITTPVSRAVTIYGFIGMLRY